DDDVAGPEGWNEHLLDIGQEAVPVDRTIDHAWRFDPVPAQRGQEGERVPAPVRDLGYQPITQPAAAMNARHVGFGPSLVDEDQTPRINPTLILLPLRATPRHVGAILLGGVQAFF